MMNLAQSKQNYYFTLKNMHLYVDFINDRIKILEGSIISEDIIGEIINYARRESLGKITALCKRDMLMPFIISKFKVEGKISGFFRGEEAFCMSYFTNIKRALSTVWQKEDNILNHCILSREVQTDEFNGGITIRDASEADIPQILKICSEASDSYPSPLFKYEYVQKIIRNNILFKVALDDEKIVSIASADMDLKNLNAEIADCVIYPQYAHRGILSKLIQSLEFDLKARGVHTLYSLSKATSISFNMVFSMLAYQYGGRLANHCSINGNFEDMNIWMKEINKDA